MKFLDKLQNEILIGDGAIGTLLYDRGHSGSIEDANRHAEEMVVSAHQEYIEAGANVIQSNTYAANQLKLMNYGLEHGMGEINAQGVRLAKHAAKGKNVYVAGTIGGIRDGRASPFNNQEIKAATQSQAEALLSEDPDVILLETYYDLHELVQAVRVIKRLSPDMPVIGNVSLGDVGVLHGGIPVNDALLRLWNEGANVIGINCRMGPAQTIASLEEISLPEGAYLSAYPNASLPGIQDGRLVYQSNPDYFKSQAEEFRKQGVHLLGGCCGTTPEHIRSFTEKLQGQSPAVKERTKVSAVREQASAEVGDTLQLDKKDPSIIVELDPPKSLTKMDKFLNGAQTLHEAGADAVTLADNSLATSRIDNLAASTLIKQQAGAHPLLHIACRDRNLIGMQSHLLGLHALGIRDVLAVTGDPTKVGDFPGATSVYDLTSFDLIRLIKAMNEGFSHSGRPLGLQTKFTVGAAFNPNVSSMAKAVKRLEKKIVAGADFVMTQPIYDVETLHQLKEATAHLDIPIYVGIMPLINGRNAEFLHNEVPGIQLTEQVRKRMAECGKDVQKGEEEGMAIAKELQGASLELFGRIYLITPFLRYHITAALTSDIKTRSAQQMRFS
ncbi:bifunctional homocysteine S-methyltransferase/methylenetetrahydrofolate reductase [Salicibibacter halophilus]|uniref:Bifunctional homocysteine S-methyltransferase/methylenetetrahydrofolate reductase n=1 Tax=Salicibibacter halophilus TaxID=2502791 RepID=A0A514LDJ2_9BACI|nr:bifunctional homocysteine S-methyltransferase/methylenetetrahydrofolate reductase [Salicibibacter halophilus]QDI89929.1 bifunctional homocysteine S-methyltransferase/methylenetetrahydrofolate reductase [Salicibibacter halophilus]